MKILKSTLWTSAVLLAFCWPVARPAEAATVLTNADGVIRNSLCVGFDCPNNPSFSDTTILMMENNTRIKFDDTSNTSSFPRNDWEIEANSNLNGGANYLGFNDCGEGSSQGGCATDLVFAVEAGVRASALYVESDGDVGFGTANPVVTLHAVDGNTPTLRLEQDGSAGFQPQTWDVAGNETNFFIRDATGGSQLPFRIQPGANSNTIFIDSDSQVGIGTSSPAQELEIRDTEDANVNTSFRISTASHSWDFATLEATGDFIISKLGTGNTELRLNAAGDLTLFGNCSDAAGGGGCTPDYVFEPDYELPTLDELAQFIALNKHLPNVPSAADNAKRGVALRGLSFALLEKIEELVLYTLQQQETIDRQQQSINGLQARLAALEEAGRQQ